MANKNIDDTNLVIGPNTQVVKGEIKKLEINGEDIPLANSVVLVDHLYAWKNEDGTDPIWAYTTTTTPAVGDNAVMPDASTLAIITDPIVAIDTDEITAFSTDFTRDTTKDIEL